MAFMRGIFSYGYGVPAEKYVKRLVDGCDPGQTWDDAVGEIVINTGAFDGSHIRVLEKHCDTLVLFTRAFKVHKVALTESTMLRAATLFANPPSHLSRTLTSVALDGVDMTDRTLSLTAPILRLLPNLKKLSLCGNKLSVAHPLQPFITGHPLPDAASPPEPGQQHGAEEGALLESLSLAGNRFGLHGDSDVRGFLDCLRGNTSLTSLDMSCNQVCGEDVSLLSGILFEEQCVLRHISLKGNPALSREEVEAITLQVEKNEELLAARLRSGGDAAVAGPEAPREQQVGGAEAAAAAEGEAGAGCGGGGAAAAEPSEASVVSRLEEEVSQLRGLVSAETKQNRQLEEDMRVSAETFMAKIADLTSKHEAQLDSMRRYGQATQSQGGPAAAVGDSSANNSFRNPSICSQPAGAVSPDEADAQARSDDGFPSPSTTAAPAEAPKARGAKPKKGAKKQRAAPAAEAPSPQPAQEFEATIASLRLQVSELEAEAAMRGAVQDEADERLSAAQSAAEEQAAALRSALAAASEDAAGAAASALSRQQQLEAEVKQQAEACDAATSREAALRHDIEALEASAKAERDTLSGDATRLQEEVAAAQLAAEGLRAELAESEARGGAAAREAARTSALLDSLREAEAAEGQGDRLAEALTQAATLQAQVDDLQEELRGAGAGASAAAEECAVLRKEAGAAADAATVLEAEVRSGVAAAEAAAGEAESLRTELQEARGVAEAAEAAAVSLRADAARLTEEASEAQGTCRRLEAEATALQGSLSAAEARGAELEAGLEEAVGKARESATASLEAANGVVAGLEAEVAALKEAVSGGEAQRDKLTEHVDELHQGLKGREAELKEAKESHARELEELRASSSGAEKQLQERLTVLEEKNDTPESAQAQAAREASMKIDKLDKQCKDGMAKLAEARAKEKEATEELEQLQLHVERFKRAEGMHSEELAELRKSRAECDAEIRSLTQKLSEQDARYKERLEGEEKRMEELQARLNIEDARRRAEEHERQFFEEDEYANVSADSGDDAATVDEGLSRKDWVSSKGVKACLRCENKFTFSNRKHHCRRCGKVFCGKCCSASPLTDNKRVCIDCNRR